MATIREISKRAYKGYCVWLGFEVTQLASDFQFSEPYCVLWSRNYFVWGQNGPPLSVLYMLVPIMLESSYRKYTGTSFSSFLISIYFNFLHFDYKRGPPIAAKTLRKKTIGQNNYGTGRLRGNACGQAKGIQNTVKKASSWSQIKKKIDVNFASYYEVRN